MTILTYFHNSLIPDSKFVHRVNTDSPTTACGLSVLGEKQTPKDVSCERCLATKTYRLGGHDACR